MIKTENLSKKYKLSRKNYFIALKDINFEMHDENMISIMGESGSGKSTFMNLVSTLDNPSGGRVYYNDKKVSFRSERRKSKYRKLNVGFVFQSFNLIADITVLQNVAVAMEIAGTGKKSREKRALELLKMVGLEDHINKKPALLSGGQKQRVAIARALANNPDVILADEPTGALDSTTSKEIMRLLKSISLSGTKILIVTHDPKVSSYCDRIVTMKDGQIIDDQVNEAKQLDVVCLPEPVKKSIRGLGFGGVFKLAKAAFTRKLKRNLLVAFSMAIAVSSILTTTLAKDTINNLFDDVEASYGNDDIAFILPTVYGDQNVVDQNREKLIEQSGILNDPNVVEYVHRYNLKYLEMSFTIGDNLNTTVFVSEMYPEGIDTFGPKDIQKGSTPKNDNEIVVNEEFLKSNNLNLENGIGAKVTVNYSDDNNVTFESREYTISGILNSSTPLVPAFLNMFYITYDEALSFGKSEKNYSSYVDTLVLLKDGTRNDFISKYENENNFSGEVQILKDLEEIDDFKAILSMVFIIFNVILGVSIVVAMILVAIMIYVSIVERMREIGVLRAIGAMKKDIRRMFYFEAIGIGILSGILALVIALSLTAVAVKFSTSYFDFNIFGVELSVHFNLSLIPITILSTTAIAIISSILSIFLGLKVSPVEALRRK